MSEVTIRPITEEDTERIVKWRNDPRVRSCFVYQKDFDRETHENWLKNVVAKNRAVQFIICTEKNGPVGSVYYSHVEPEEHTAEFGIFIGEQEAVGKGIGAAATKLALDYAFDQMELQTVFLRVFCDNVPAIGNYRKFGFRTAEVLKDVECTSGEIRDMYWMKLTKQEYFEEFNEGDA